MVVYSCVCASLWRPELSLVVSLDVSTPYSLRESLPLNLQLTISVRLAGHQVLQTCLSLLSTGVAGVHYSARSYVDSEDPKSVFMLVPKALYSLIPLPGPQALVHSSTFPHSPPCKTVEAGVLCILPTSKSEKSCFSKKSHT